MHKWDTHKIIAVQTQFYWQNVTKSVNGAQNIQIGVDLSIQMWYNGVELIAWVKSVRRGDIGIGVLRELAKSVSSEPLLNNSYTSRL